jgi:nicotinate phosphoribosyltransferase
MSMSSYHSKALLTDFYQLTMSYGYWKANMHNRIAAFHLNFRKKPFNGSFAIAAGLSDVIDFIENFRFSSCDIKYLSSLLGGDNTPIFETKFLDYLHNLKLTVDIDAIEEGMAVFPYEPILRVTGPILQVQLLESSILNIINFQTLIATKAARIVEAAYPQDVVEFGLRRAQGENGAIAASRAAYIGGVSATSNVLAGKMLGIPVSGTHSHSWIMAFDTEEKAFEEYVKIFPHQCNLLVDTYNSIEGAKKAIAVVKKASKNNVKLLGLRLDSGDLANLSIIIRKMLDEEGLFDTKIVASNELDENIIKDLKQQGAKIDVWAVGTNLVTGGSQGALDGIYKLTAIKDNKDKWQYKVKVSEQIEKVSCPGILQVRRFVNDDNYYAGDVIYDENNYQEKKDVFEAVDPVFYSVSSKFSSLSMKYKDMLVPIFRKGKCVYKKRLISTIRENTMMELQKLKPSVKRFLNPESYFAGVEKTLNDERCKLIHKKNK